MHVNTALNPNNVGTKFYISKSTFAVHEVFVYIPTANLLVSVTVALHYERCGSCPHLIAPYLLIYILTDLFEIVLT